MTYTLSARATRKNACYNMRADPPSLIPPVRQKSYIDYESLSQADKNKCERLIDEYQRTGDIACPSQGLYFKLMAVLREKRRLCSKDGDFAKAEEYDNLIRQLSQFFAESHLYKAKSIEVSTAENKYNTTRSQLFEAEDKWRTQIDKMRVQSARANKRIQDICDEQIANYDNQLKDTLPPEYCKLSPELLNIKDRERHMIGCRMFKEAQELHKEFEKRQQIELQRRREEYFKSFEISRVALEKRTQRRINACKSDWERKLDHENHLATKELRHLRDGTAAYGEQLMAAKSEYIGEDDPIINAEKDVYDSRTYRISPPTMTRGITPRSIINTTRTIQRPSASVTTKQMSNTMMKQSRRIDSTRWPR